MAGVRVKVKGDFILQSLAAPHMWPISVLHSFSTYIHGHSLSSMCVYIYACMELYVANFNVHN